MKFKNQEMSNGRYGNEEAWKKKLYCFDDSLDLCNCTSFTVIVARFTIATPIHQPKDGHSTVSMRQSISNLIEFLKRPFKCQPIRSSRLLKNSIEKKREKKKKLKIIKKIFFSKFA